jgi:septal ring factor EnvC (AmiA/AmiB activator)
MRRTGLIVLLLALVVGPLLAQSSGEDVKGTVQGTVDLDQRTQEERDAWANEQAELEARYRTAKANIAYLTERIAGEEKAIAGLTESIAELERRMHEARVLENILQDTLDTVMNRLTEFVDQDLPFLTDERDHRIEVLARELARPEVAGAEKLRRLLEALQIETEYGKSVEVEQQEINLDGEPVFADVLRVGRVSLFWQTPDGDRAGTFDRATWEWVELPPSHGRPIGIAIEMASRIRPVQLIELPLGRVER